jgi:4'-phosphopantetheinyl transferase
MLAGWASPPPTPQLKLLPAEVHVWRAGLDLDAAQLERLRMVISPDEQARAARFYFEKDRQRFISSHGILREILSRYLKREAAQLEFSHNRFGKPSLAPEVSGDGIFFNLSHSSDLALYAVSRFPEIGVDLEYVKRDFPCEEIARHYFSPQEIRTLQSLPEAVKYEAFFNCWTRKEAFVKARGKGLSLPLDQFTVSLSPGEPVVLLRAESDYEETSNWTLSEIIPAEGYIAALAVEGRNWRLKCWQWSG